MVQRVQWEWILMRVGGRVESDRKKSEKERIENWRDVGEMGGGDR